MLSKPIAIALLAATCVIAAAGGAYVAIRQNNQTDHAPAEVSASDEMEAAATAVEMTEAVVEVVDSAAAPSPTPTGHRERDLRAGRSQDCRRRTERFDFRSGSC